MTPTTTIAHTYEDYAKLPEGAPYQLIGGELVPEPSPTLDHQRVQRRLGTAMILFVEEHLLGEVLYAPMDVHLSESDVYQPDILFISTERSSILQDRIEGAPDLVVEILSPSTAYYDLRHKMYTYADHDVREYWVVDPLERSVDVYANREGSFQLLCTARRSGIVRSEVLNGFSIPLDMVFR